MLLNLPPELLTKILRYAASDLYPQVPTLRLVSGKIKSFLDEDSLCWSGHLTEEELQAADEQRILYKEVLIQRTQKLLAILNSTDPVESEIHQLMVEGKKDLKIAHQLVTHPRLKRYLIETGFHKRTNLDGDLYVVADLGCWYPSIACFLISDLDFYKAFWIDCAQTQKLLTGFFGSEEAIQALCNQPKLFNIFKQNPYYVVNICHISESQFLTIFENAQYKAKILMLAELSDDATRAKCILDDCLFNRTLILQGQSFEVLNFENEEIYEKLSNLELVNLILEGIKQRNLNENNAQPSSTAASLT